MRYQTVAPYGFVHFDEEVPEDGTFDSFEQRLIVPSDAALLAPAYGGLYLPNGGRLAIEDMDGTVRSLLFRRGEWFRGLIPARVRSTGSDPGIVAYALYGGGLSAIPTTSGTRAPQVVPSDGPVMDDHPIGGIYAVEPGFVSYRIEDGSTRVVEVFGDAYISDTRIVRVNATGTTVPTIYGFYA